MRQDVEATRIFFYEARGHILAKMQTFIRNRKAAMEARNQFAVEHGVTDIAGYEGVYYILKFAEAPARAAWRYNQSLGGYSARLATSEGRELHRIMFTPATKVPTMAGFCRSIHFNPWQEYPDEVFPGIHQVDDTWYISLPAYFKPRTCRLLSQSEAAALMEKLKACKPKVDERRLATA